MGRRRADAAEPPAELQNVRRSSRLAQKDRVDYNESKMAAKVMSNSLAISKKTAAPRKSKKEKVKLSKSGVVAVRTVRETFTSSLSRTGSPENTMAVFSSGTVINGTPVTTRTHSASRRAALANAAETRRDGGLYKKSEAPLSITPDCTQLDALSLALRPVKQESRREISPDDIEVARGRAPRAVRLFDDDGAPDGGFDDTLIHAMDNTLLADVNVPERRKKKKDTVVHKSPAAKKGTVAKKEAAAAKKIPRASPFVTPKAKKNGRMMMMRESRSITMERVTVQRETRPTQERELEEVEDDAFAGEITVESNDLEQSTFIYSQLEAGEITPSQLAPEFRHLGDLFSPVTPAKTPRLDASLRCAIVSHCSPLIISSNTGRRITRAAVKKQQQLAVSIYAEQSDSDEVEMRTPSEVREMEEPDPQNDFYAKRARGFMKDKVIRKLFAASAGGGSAKNARALENVPRQAPREPQRKKIPYPCIAPLSEDEEEEDNKGTVALFRQLDIV